MKFTDGFWLTRPGVTLIRPQSVAEVEVEERSLVVYAAPGRLEKRGDTLNKPLLTVTLTTPADGVIGVKVEHHIGGVPPKPVFALAADDADLDVETGSAGALHWAKRADGDRAGEAWLRSGPLTATVSTDGGLAMRFEAFGAELTSTEARGTAYATDADGIAYIREQLALDVREHIYGLGERFGAFVKNGQTVDMWNADGGTSSEQAYKNVPFYLSSKGYGVFVDHPGKVSYEVGSEVVTRTQFSVAGESMQYYVIAGPTPKDVLTRYTALTGRPARLPQWSYGLWLTTSFTTSYDEKTVLSFIDGMAQRRLPLSVFHFDCFWMGDFRWVDFTWDPAVFPDPEGMLERLHGEGLKVCAWINPYVAQRSSLFAEARELGYLVRRADGSVWQWDLWQAGMGLVDFTNPEASAWFGGKIRGLLRQGVDAIKTDFGERIPTDVVWHDGSDPERMRNYYTHLYNKVVFEAIEEVHGAGEAVLFARSATAGGQQFPVHWGGDCESTFVSMAESLRGGLSLSMSGFGFWSHDIGGFEGTPDPAVFKRWLAFGLMSSHSRLHGSDSVRVPWAFDEEAVEITRSFTNLKLTLMPYLAQLGVEAHETGIPVMRPMALEFPGDPGSATVDTQYMLGPDLLVAPVFTASGDVDVYLPEGVWTSLLTGEQVTGPRWVHEVHGFDSLPLYVRDGAVLPIGARDDTPDYDLADGVTLRVVGTAAVSTVVRIPRAEGEATFTVTRTASGQVQVHADGAPGAWAVEVGGVRYEAAADSAVLTVDGV